MRDVREGTGFIGGFDHEDFGGDGEGAAFFQEPQGSIRIADDEPDDDMIHGVAGGDGVDVYFLRAEDIAQTSQHAGPIFQEDGELFCNLHAGKLAVRPVFGQPGFEINARAG